MAMQFFILQLTLAGLWLAFLTFATTLVNLHKYAVIMIDDTVSH